MIYTVPNVSEGRDPAIIATLAEALGSHSRVLDIDPGDDAHRTVLTAAPRVAPEELVEANFQLAKAAVERIDLRQHRGAHVRMGAIDVIPFVPLHGEVEAAWKLADQLSRRVADDLGVPVYRYGLGSRTLRQARRQGFEVLAQTMAEMPPDYGPSTPHPTAGAVAIGVRAVLVAWNISLGSRDVHLARALARKVRASAGGFPGVQAIGWDMPRLGCAQVSTNLLSWQQTPPHVVYEAIAAEAPVIGSELVGLLPEGALAAAAAFYGTDLAGAAARLGLARHKAFSLENKLLERRLGAGA